MEAVPIVRLAITLLVPPLVCYVLALIVIALDVAKTQKFVRIVPQDII